MDLEDLKEINALSTSAGSDAQSVSGSCGTTLSYGANSKKSESSGLGSSGGGSRKASAKPPSPCLVCGLIKTEMPVNSKYCYDHKRATDALVSSLRQKDRRNGNTEGMDNFNNLRNSAGPPPSTFASMVLEYEERCPAGGRGVKRGSMDTMQLVQKHSAKTEMRKEFRRVLMHHARWMKHATTVLMLPVSDAQSLWEATERSTPKEERDTLGPEGALRLPMHIEDAIVGANVMTFEKSLNVESKRRKITNEEMIQDARTDLSTGHVAFGDAMFSQLGGALAADSARIGGSWMSLQGGGVFSGAASSDGSQTTSQKQGGFDIVIGDGAGATKKEKIGQKAWDSETQQIKLCTQISSTAQSLLVKIEKATQHCKNAMDSTIARMFASGSVCAVPHQGRYLDIMQNRFEIMLYLTEKPILFADITADALATSCEAATKLGEFFQSLCGLAPDVDGSCDVSPLDAQMSSLHAVVVGKCYVDVSEIFSERFFWSSSAKKFTQKLSLAPFYELKEVVNSAHLKCQVTEKVLKDDNTLSGLLEVISELAKLVAAETFEPTALTGQALKLRSVTQAGGAKDALDKHGWTGSSFAEPLQKPAVEQLRSDLTMAWAEAFLRARLQTMVRMKESAGKAMPVENVGDFPLLHDFDQLLAQASATCTEDEDKMVKLTLGVMKDRWEKLLKTVHAGATECINNVASYEKKLQVDAEKKKKQLALEEAKRQREATKKAAADLKKKVESRSKSTSTVPLLDLNHGVFKPWRTFTTEAEFFEARQQKASEAGGSAAVDWDAGEPYVILDHQAMSKLAEERSIKASLGVFKIQYPSSEQATKEGRGQTPYNSDRKASVRETLLNVMPPRLVKYTSTPTTIVAERAIEQVSFFGFSPGASYTGLEKHSLPTARYCTSGQREIAVLSFSDMLSYADRAGLEIGSQQEFQAYIDTIMDTLTDSSALDLYMKGGACIYRHLVKSGQTTVVPLGAYIVERTVGDVNVIGFRAASLLSAKVPLQSFSLYTQAFVKVHGDTHPVSQYWAKLTTMFGKDWREAGEL